MIKISRFNHSCDSNAEIVWRTSEKEEIEIIEEFLPKQLSEDDLDKEITAIIEELGASEIKDMGRVMGVASKKLSGKADNGRIAKIIKEKLN